MPPPEPSSEPNEAPSGADAALNLIGQTPPAVPPPSAVEASQAERLQYENAKLAEELNELRQNRAERKKYALRVFVVLNLWLVVVAYVLLAQGFKYGAPKLTYTYIPNYRPMITMAGAAPFQLSDNVVIALLTTTTGSIIGVFLIVAKYLFPAKP
jgi:hypothetical protein